MIDQKPKQKAEPPHFDVKGIDTLLNYIGIDTRKKEPLIDLYLKLLELLEGEVSLRQLDKEATKTSLKVRLKKLCETTYHLLIKEKSNILHEHLKNATTILRIWCKYQIDKSEEGSKEKQFYLKRNFDIHLFALHHVYRPSGSIKSRHFFKIINAATGAKAYDQASVLIDENKDLLDPYYAINPSYHFGFAKVLFLKKRI